MDKKIKSKILQRGHEHESDWPPIYGEGSRGCFWYDTEAKCMTQEPPARPISYGCAPAIIQDTLKTAYYHPGACKWTESRSELNALDQKTGTITTDKKIPPSPTQKRQRDYERLQDIKEAQQKAIAAIDNGSAKISEETQAICDEENERITKATGVDAFNIAGKKRNDKSRRLRKYVRK